MLCYYFPNRKIAFFVDFFKLCDILIIMIVFYGNFNLTLILFLNIKKLNKVVYNTPSNGKESTHKL